ncbi:MAG: zf-HC2 domain-containing protein [Candidatus Didemnitutus sp.]|nr:zf-HC2 domain-containing protein [Candidatus Didemnitutus sp.]
MKCRIAIPLLSAERDAALPGSQARELAQHLAECASCRQAQLDLPRAMAEFRDEVAAVPVPDAAGEWRLLQARLRELRQPAPRATQKVVWAWLAAPLAAAAALAIAFLVGRTPPLESQVVPLAGESFARVDFIEVADASATPLVYVDRESGWLVVWAVEGESSGHG